MTIPDLSLPFDVALPAFALTVLAGAILGALTAAVLLTPGSARQRPPSHPLAWAGIAALIAGCLLFGAFADRGQASLAAAAVAAAAGALACRSISGRVAAARAAGGAATLSEGELRRDKTRSDRWVLVTGPADSGKSELVAAMIAAARERLARPVRSARAGDLRATELAVQDRRGSSETLRLWEATAVGDELPPLEDFDAVVLTIDPLRHAPLADSFPDALRGDRLPVDANESVLELAGLLRGDCLVWAVATKADLLRFSVHPGLLEWPLQAGPGWYRQVRSMSVMERRGLAEALGLEELTREHRPSFDWGTGSPLFACRGGARRRPPFGAPELMNSMLEVLWPVMS